MSFTFSKKEKLKSKKRIEQLFAEGKSVSAYPLRLVFMPCQFEENTLAQTGISVSKRHFKLAVDRNRIKRLMREAYRLNKATYFNNLSQPYAFMILYIGKDKPKFDYIEKRMQLLFEKFRSHISEK
ncbi:MULTISPECIES: ribonuclease P protein component [Pseudotamlana]|uniref:Ribonuclease P protein component n=1 Tax=Pseudotamlana carrageenivorans TaxID=2069432 RepID=A0A2I7SGY9_9FLAO|nr:MULTISPECIES: ribonuclease P protein component [Tamlana]AUS05168.1 ribonuclease P protein component [Tamlana carrageenivorans]